MIKEKVAQNIEKARQGRALWIDVASKCAASNEDYVILFPGAYDDWAHYGALYLDDFLAAKNSERAVVLYHDEKIRESLKICSAKAEAVYFSREDAEKIMAFYNLYQFAGNLVIFSPNEPAGRNGGALVGKKGITVEEVAVLGIYGLKTLKGGGDE